MIFFIFVGVVTLRLKHYRLPQLPQKLKFFYQGLTDCSVYNSLNFIIVQVYHAIVHKGQFFSLSPLLVNQIDTYTESQWTPTQLL